ncbi:hypothetical protein NEHOM01_1264 [Nematocida homosporus]|uniref:uncharacterized protein n=1 Tax=Nematocida homosporus TaxID=1912981 RepID=UPI00221FE894|nr:uncharacterized protein NEHOM01_1264 [Nematocida homosporus]KAI5186082.1 hypothetical protein NEHOM01_1264 [Nematocida homosporus]
MVSKEVLANLPAAAKKELAKVTEKFKNGEMTQDEYKELCAEIVSNYEDEESGEEKVPEVKKGRPANKEDQKPEYMSDIIQYAGVNLKEEAMQIAKEADKALPYEETKGSQNDHQNSIESLFDTHMFIYFVNKICKLREVGISDEAMQVVFLACKRKIMDVLEKLIEQSKIRVDAARCDYLIRIENDRRRQMWFLEQEERLEMDKYRQKKEGDDGDGKKKWRKILQEREDLIIKKRLSNNVALAALGSQPKSWMAASAASGDDGSAPYLTLFQGSEDRTQKTNTRIIIKEDFLSVLSRDKRYNKSVFTIKHSYV